MNPDINPDNPETWPKMKLTCSGLKHLQDKCGINVLAGEVPTDSPEKIAELFFAATRSWKDAPTIEEISDHFGIAEIMVGVQRMLSVTSGEDQKKITPLTTSEPG